MTKVLPRATWVLTVIMKLPHLRTPFSRMAAMAEAHLLNLLHRRHPLPQMATIRVMEILKVRLKLRLNIKVAQSTGAFVHNLECKL